MCVCDGREKVRGGMIKHLKLAIPVGYLLHSPSSQIELPTILLAQYITADIQLLQIHLQLCTFVYFLSSPG